jgi:hypothetical protein
MRVGLVHAKEVTYQVLGRAPTSCSSCEELRFQQGPKGMRGTEKGGWVKQIRAHPSARGPLRSRNTLHTPVIAHFLGKGNTQGSKTSSHSPGATRGNEGGRGMEWGAAGRRMLEATRTRVGRGLFTRLAVGQDCTENCQIPYKQNKPREKEGTPHRHHPQSTMQREKAHAGRREHRVGRWAGGWGRGGEGRGGGRGGGQGRGAGEWGRGGDTPTHHTPQGTGGVWYRRTHTREGVNKAERLCESTSKQ